MADDTPRRVRDWLRSKALGFALLMFCEAIVLLPPQRPPGGFAFGGSFRLPASWTELHALRWSLALLVSVPFVLTGVASWRAMHQAWDQCHLELGPLPRWPAKPGNEEAASSAWAQAAKAVRRSWEYERGRYLASLRRLDSYALVFSDVVTVALASGVLVLTASSAEQTWAGLDPMVVKRLMISVAAAAATAFFVGFVRITVRISSGDISSRMFAWGTRAIALVVAADMGLFFLLEGVISDTGRALVLGLFAGATGDRALDLLLTKAAAVFKTTASVSAGTSPLLALEGITQAHADRLEEEGILSLHDLAFVPTARLFFTTPYSLQQICDWQDRALLWVYMGADDAKKLYQHLKILGAIDMMYCARVVNNQDAGKGVRMDSLKNALGMDEGGLAEMLDSIEDDGVTMRLRVLWQATVTHRGGGEAERPGTDLGVSELAAEAAVFVDLAEEAGGAAASRH